MRGPEELVDGEDAVEGKPGLDQGAGVTGESGGIAGDGDDARDGRAGELGGLFGGAGAGRVEDGGDAWSP